MSPSLLLSLSFYSMVYLHCSLSEKRPEGAAAPLNSGVLNKRLERQALPNSPTRQLATPRFYRDMTSYGIHCSDE